MRPPLRAVLALVVALPIAFALGLFLSPDPTGFVPIVAGAVLTVVLATALYRLLPDGRSESTAD